tara:strand:+ start:1891 stop:2067 length:177 start_codon:yes stop_codon:yes gene_type:complete
MDSRVEDGSVGGDVGGVVNRLESMVAGETGENGVAGAAAGGGLSVGLVAIGGSGGEVM